MTKQKEYFVFIENSFTGQTMSLIIIAENGKKCIRVAEKEGKEHWGTNRREMFVIKTINRL